MIALGAYFTPKFSKLKLSIIVILVKMIGVLFIGFVIGRYYHLMRWEKC